MENLVRDVMISLQIKQILSFDSGLLSWFIKLTPTPDRLRVKVVTIEFMFYF